MDRRGPDAIIYWSFLTFYSHLGKDNDHKWVTRTSMDSMFSRSNSLQLDQPHSIYPIAPSPSCIPHHDQGRICLPYTYKVKKDIYIKRQTVFLFVTGPKQSDDKRWRLHYDSPYKPFQGWRSPRGVLPFAEGFNGSCEPWRLCHIYLLTPWK